MAKSGLEQAASAKRDSNSTEPCAYSVLEAKSGTKFPKHVSAKLEMSGMETSVKRNSTAQAAEFGTKSIKFVFVPMVKPGTALLALSKSHVAVESSGTIPVYNAIVLMDSTGMEEHVSSVQMV